MCLHILLAAPLAHLLLEPEVLERVADRSCLAVDLLLADLVALGQPDVAMTLLTAHLRIADEEQGSGHAHLLDERYEPDDRAVLRYIDCLTQASGPVDLPRSA